jgi:peptide deformylase
MEFSLAHTPILNQASTPWIFSQDTDPEKLEYAMINFMLDNRGIGLAANQIGMAKRIFTMGSEIHTDFVSPRAFFNPEIVEESKELILDTEGCLSYPGLWLTVKRPKWVIASFFTSAGKQQTMKFDGYQAKCFQHELDHLNGICFIDKVSKLKLQLALKKQGKKQK